MPLWNKRLWDFFSCALCPLSSSLILILLKSLVEHKNDSDDNCTSPILRNRKSSKLTAGFFLHKLSLTIDDAENEQSQQDSSQGTADHSSQGCVSWAGGCGRDLHEVDLAGTWKPDKWNQHSQLLKRLRHLHWPLLSLITMAFIQYKSNPRKPVGGT